jgi:hypothetical protein
MQFGKSTIKRVETVKYLGVELNEHLDWKYHIENLSKSLVKIASTFKFLRKKVHESCKKLLYYAYVHSKITYGIEIYGNSRIVRKIQVMQNRALKILYEKRLVDKYEYITQRVRIVKSRRYL